jgi:hypothetical protein
MAVGTHRRTWIFLSFFLSLLLSFAWLALRPSFPLLHNPSATVSKNLLSMPRMRFSHPLLPQRSPKQEIVIDPVLVYSTFLGGSAVGVGSLTGPSSGPGQVFAQGVTATLVDGSGNLYVGGSTSAADFPTTAGVVQPTNSQNNSVGFLSKINAAGQLIFSTYLHGMQSVASIAVDSQDQDIYVAGVSPLVGTASTPLPIPPSTTPFQSVPRPISIVKLNGTATAVLNATYLGGSAIDLVSGLALDPTGNVYVDGYTTSNDFPTMNPLQGTLGTSGHNAFVTKLMPDLGSLVYSTYLGQNNSVVGAGVATPTGTASHGIAVDGTGNAYVILAGASAGCLAKLNVDGSSVTYPNFSCGANAVAVDGSNNLYAAGGGNTGATSGSLAPCPQPPPTPEPPTWLGAGGFVSEFNSAGTLTFSTCLGLLYSANGGPRANGGVNDLVLDASGNIYVVGSVDGGIPLTNAIQDVTSMFVAAIDPRTPSLLFASGIGTGGSSDNAPTSVAVDPSGNIYASGSIANPTSFPVFNALQSIPGMVLQPSNCGGCGTNSFLLEIAPTNAAAAALTPGLVAFGLQPVSTTSAGQTVTISDLGSAPLTVSNVVVTGDFAIQNGCGTVSAVGGTCTIQVTFTPTVTGTRTGTLTITDNSAGSPHTVRLSGQGAGAAAMLSPTSLSFPTQSPGTTSASQQVTLTNTGTLDLQVAHIATTAPFSETNLCGATLAAGQSCLINVLFSPTATGSATGTLTVTDSAADSPQTVTLTGTGGSPSLGLGVHGSSVGSMSTKAGGTVVYTLAIGGAGIGGTATLSCSGAPQGASCSVSPSPVKISASSVSAVSATVVTTAHSGLLSIPRGSEPWRWRLILAGLGIVILVGEAFRSGSLRLRWRLVPLLAMFLCACGGGSGSGGNSGGTPVGSYTLVVTATSGSSSQTLNLTLEVQ